MVNYRRKTFYISAEVDKRLKIAVAHMDDKSRSEVVESALKDYLNRIEATVKQ